MPPTILPALSPYQSMGMFCLILYFWYSGVLVVANIEYYIQWSVPACIIISICSAPLAYYSIKGVVWVLHLKTTQTTSVIGLVTITVSLLHILGLYFKPDWYTVSGKSLLLAGGWLCMFSALAITLSQRWF